MFVRLHMVVPIVKLIVHTISFREVENTKARSNSQPCVKDTASQSIGVLIFQSHQCLAGQQTR